MTASRRLPTFALALLAHVGGWVAPPARALDPGPLCEECRDRANFVGLLFVCVAVAVVVLVTFVILVD
jgi:hypothetical protein